MSGIESFFNRFNMVRDIPVFSNLNWFDLQKVASKIIISKYKKGDIVSKQGNVPDFFYCLYSGRLQAYTEENNEDSRNQIDYIHRGMYFGVISTFTGENHSMTFEALNDSVVLKIPKDDFKEILKKIPILGVLFSKSLSKRMRRKVLGNEITFESKIISVYSPLKGTGSSTYAINMALSLKKETDKKVILVSILRKTDEKKDFVFKEGPVFDCEESSASFQDIADNYKKIKTSIIKNDLPIDLINVIFDPVDESIKNKISPFVSSLVGDYHYVIVDLPNEMDDFVSETLTQSDQICLLSFNRDNDLKLIKSIIISLQINLQDSFKSENIKLILRIISSKKNISLKCYNEFIGHDVFATLPNIVETDIDLEFECKTITFVRCKEGSKYEKVIRSISREIGEVRVGLSLGGGAALGMAHIGVLSVLEKEGIPIDAISGSSMGALIGSLWAIGKNSDELKEIAYEFKKKRNLTKLIDPVFPISGFMGGRKIKKWFKKHIGDRTFYDTNIPLKIIAYDLNKRQDIVCNSGSIVDALRKSISIPGIMTPIKNGDELIIDGGVMNPLPTNVLASIGVQKIISVNVLQSPSDIQKKFSASKGRELDDRKKSFILYPLSFIWHRIAKFLSDIFKPSISDIIVLTLQAAEYVIAEQSAQQADVSIHPDIAGIDWYELYKVDELIKRGEDAAYKHLPEIKRLIEFK